MDRRNELLNFAISPATLAGKFFDFKNDLSQSYEKVDQHTMKSLIRLFGTTHLITAGLPWDDWIPNMGVFSAERIELCKKVLLIFAYFDRAGNHYADDYGLIGTLLGRFTHCPDGKKTGIESVSTNALNGFMGPDALMGDQEAVTFDEYLKKIILKDFKNDTITALCDHPGDTENVSIIAKIKHENQHFWNVPTATQPANGMHGNWDYALVGTGIDGSNNVARYFYQHIYAGPYELVNKILSYLKSADAEKRSIFFKKVLTMLVALRPFSDWEAADKVEELIQARYCEIIPSPVGAAPGAEPDYIFTSKGIEMILFYAGYLAWNGAANDHPLIADWNANLDWLRTNDADTYREIYTH